MNYVFAAIFVLFGINFASAAEREDGAIQLDILLRGSLQNPVFSPDGSEVLFTRFRRGYNRGPSDLYIFTLSTGALRALVSDGSSNVNLPGASWNRRTNQIVFSSTRGHHDEVFAIDAAGQPRQERQLTYRANLQGFEPSYSPDGRWVVFESHLIDVDEGVITKHRIGSDEYVDLTFEAETIKQPNWSPAGDFILYQQLEGDIWSIWVMKANGNAPRKITSDAESATDAAFSDDGRSIVYSSENEGTLRSNIYVISQSGREQITNDDAYDGAPSFSPDGRWIAFESTPRDPDGSRGSTIWIIERP